MVFPSLSLVCSVMGAEKIMRRRPPAKTRVEPAIDLPQRSGHQSSPMDTPSRADRPAPETREPTPDAESGKIWKTVGQGAEEEGLERGAPSRRLHSDSISGVNRCFPQ